MSIKNKLKSSFSKAGKGIKKGSMKLGSQAKNIARSGYENVKASAKGLSAGIKSGETTKSLAKKGITSGAYYKGASMAEERRDLNEFKRKEKLKFKKKQFKKSLRAGKPIGLRSYDNPGIGYGGKFGLDSNAMLFGKRKPSKGGGFNSDAMLFGKSNKTKTKSKKKKDDYVIIKGKAYKKG